MALISCTYDLNNVPHKPFSQDPANICLKYEYIDFAGRFFPISLIEALSKDEIFLKGDWRRNF